MITGITFGTWDLLHAGHIIALSEAKKKCDRLIVGLQVDPSVDRPGKHKPVQSVLEREIQLTACKYVDRVIVYETERDLEEMLSFVPWDVRFMDETYKARIITAEWTRSRVVYTRREHTYSTTELRQRVARAEK